MEDPSPIPSPSTVRPGFQEVLSLLFVFARFAHTHLVAPSLAFAQMPRFCDEDCLEGIKKLLNCDW